MRRVTIRLLLILTVLATAALACVLPGGSATPAPNPVLTAAAETLSALATAMAGSTSTPEPVITPTTEPSSTNTPEPVPAGAKLAYVDTSRNLWAWIEGAAPLQLTTSGDVDSVQLSPDGALAAFTRTSDYASFSLWVISTSGGSERRLLDSGELTTMGMVDGAVSASPDQLVWRPGTHTLGVSTRPVFEGPGLLRNGDLTFIDADSGLKTPIFERGAGGIYSFSPDGTRMAIARTDRVDLANWDGSGRLSGLVTFSPVLTYSEYAFYPEPVWAPDNSHFVVAIPPSASLDANGPTQLYQVNADGSTSTLRSFETAPLNWPSVSPDLAQTAYMTAGDPFNLWLIQSTGDLGGLNIPSVRSFFGWAPDSVRVAYVDNVSGAVMIGGIAGTPAPLPGAVDVVNLAWLSDGRIVYTVRAGSGWELHIAAPGEAGGVLAPLGSGTGFPSFDLP